MLKLVDFIKGLMIGVANVIPGLSGGTLAVILGVYERMIEGLSDALKHPIKAFKALFFLILGVLVGIVVAIFIVVFFLERYPVPTTMLFVGFILGGIPKVWSMAKCEKKTIVHYLLFGLMFAIIVAMPLINAGEIIALSLSFGNLLVLVLVGILAASAMVVPGVSGSMMLVILGYYFFITNELSAFVTAFFSLDIQKIGQTTATLFPFGVGVLVGIFGLAKAIKQLLKTHYSHVYWAILGLIVASPIPILYLMEGGVPTPINIILGVLAGIFGTIFSLKMSTLKEWIIKS